MREIMGNEWRQDRPIMGTDWGPDRPGLVVRPSGAAYGDRTGAMGTGVMV